MDRSLLLEVRMLARLAAGLIDDAVAPTGLVAREFVPYSLLGELGETTPTDLARLSGVPATTISKMLRRMAERGDLVESENPDDARSRFVALAASGERRLEQARVGFEDAVAELDGLLGAEGPQIAFSLQRLRHALRALAGDEPGEGPVRPNEARAHEVRYVGSELTASEAAQVADFIDFVRGRR